jgi:hypothetical protein
VVAWARNQSNADRLDVSLHERYGRQATSTIAGSHCRPELERARTQDNIQAEADQDNLVLAYQGVGQYPRRRAESSAARPDGRLRQHHARGPGARSHDRVTAQLDNAYFTWSGGTSDEDAFYYRIHSPVVLRSSSTTSFPSAFGLSARRIGPRERTSLSSCVHPMSTITGRICCANFWPHIATKDRFDVTFDGAALDFASRISMAEASQTSIPAIAAERHQRRAEHGHFMDTMRGSRSTAD